MPRVYSSEGGGRQASMEDHERASVQASEHLGVQTRKRGEHSKHLGQLKCSLILDKAEKK